MQEVREAAKADLCLEFTFVRTWASSRPRWEQAARQF